MPSRRRVPAWFALVTATLVVGTMPRAESASRFPSLHAFAPLPATQAYAASPSRGVLVAYARPRDTEPPVLILTDPPEDAIVTTPTITVRGTVSDDDDTVTVRVEGHRVPLSAGAFAVDVPLGRGANRIEVEARDAAGNHTRLTRNVRFEDLSRIQAPVPPSLVVAGLPDLGHLALAPDGAWLVTAPQAGRIYRVPLDGSLPQLVVEHLRRPLGIVAGEDGTLFVAERGADRILRIAPDGTRSIVLEQVEDPRGLAWGPDGALFLTARRWPRRPHQDAHPGVVLRLDPASGGVQVLAEGFIRPEGLVVAPDGSLWVVAQRRQADRVRQDGPLFQITASGMVIPEAGPRLRRPRGITRDALGSLWITARRQLSPPEPDIEDDDRDDAEDQDKSAARGPVLKRTPEGAWQVFANGLDEPAGLAFAGQGDLVVVEADQGRILRFRAPPAPHVVVPHPTNAPSVALTGSAELNALVVVRGPAGAGTTPVDAEGRFQVSLPLLPDQPNPLEVFAVAAVGTGLASAPTLVTVIQDTVLPTLRVEEPPSYVLTNGTAIPVRGQVSDSNPPVQVFVNDGAVPVDPTGGFATTMPLQEGPNPLTVRAVDAAGNVSTESCTVVRDTTPPGIVVTSPVEGAVVPGVTVAVSGTVTDLHPPVTVTVNGQVVLLSSDGRFTAEIPFPITQTTITLTSADRAGNVTTLTRTVVRDATPPVLTLVAGPADPTNSRTLTVRVTATDNVTPSDQLQFAFSLDSEGDYSAYGPAPTVAYADVSDGVHTIRMKARDQAGNESTPLAMTVRVDTVPPTITLTGPPTGFRTNQSQVTVSGMVTDTSTITDLSVNGQAVSLSGTSFSQSLSLTEGANTITVTAKDAAGNAGTTTISGTLDTVPPLVSFSTPAADAVLNASPLTVSGTVNEAVTALNVNGVAATVSAGTFSVILVPIRGRNTLTATATDLVGNVGIANLSFTFDDVAPVVRILTPTNGQILSQANLTVTGTVDDPAASVTVNGVSATILGGIFTATGVPVSAGSVTLTAQAVDPAGNHATSVITVTVDPMPPTITSLAAPAEVTAGTAATLSVEASDNLGLATLDLLVDGRLVVSGPTSPVGVSFTIPPDKAMGDTLTVTARAVDVAGLATTQLATMRVTSAAVGPGFLRGLVLDDTKGLPLAGVTVSVQSEGGTPVDPQVTGPDGQYAFTLEPGTALVRVTKDGATTVERKVPVRSDLLTVVPDARLTPRDPRVTVLGSAGGTADDEAITIRLAVPANAVIEDISLRITPVSDQGLIARLPLGWTPVVVADIAPASLTMAAPGVLSVRLPDALQSVLPAGTSVAFVRYEPTQAAWVALDRGTVTTDGLAIEAALSSGGQVAFLLPDPDPLTPPAAVAGAVLAGVSAAAIPEDATATGSVSPAAIPPGAITAKGQVTVTPTAPLPSGTLVQAVVSERYSLLSGEEVTPPSFAQDLVLYQSAIGYPLGAPQSEMPTLSALFPVTPSKTYTLRDLAIGTAHLAIQTPETGGQGTIIGPEGGMLTASDGTILTIPPGALSRETVVAVVPLSESDLRVAIPAGFQVLKAVNIDLTRATLLLSAELAFPLPAGITTDTQVLVARVLEVDGILRLQAVGMGQVSGALLSSHGTIEGLSLPGVTIGGTYVVLRATNPVGFVAGTITDTGGGTKAGVLVSSGTGLVDVSRSDGSYLVVTAAGSATITATDRATGQGATQTLTVPTGGAASQPLQVQVIPPTVVSVTPAAGARNIPVNTQVSVIFSQPIARASLTASSLLLSGLAGPVETTITLSPLGTEATLYPAKALASQTIYSLVASQAIQDTHGVSLPAPFTSQFTTASAPPPPPPAGSLTVSFPDEQGNVTVTATQGTAAPDNLVVVLNVTSGTVASATVSASGGFTTSLFAMLGDELLVMIQDGAGSQTVVSPGPYRSADGQFVMTAAGGALDTPEGINLTLSPSAVTRPVTMKMTTLTLDQVAAAIPPALQFLGGLHLDTQGATFKTGAKVSLPVPGGVTIPNGAQPFLARLQLVNGRLTPVLVDAMRVINGRLTTSSPPFPGVQNEGDYVALLPTNPFPAVVTGSILREGTTPPQPVAGAIVKVDGTEVVATADDKGKYALDLFPPDITKPTTFNLVALDPTSGAMRGATLTVPAWTVPNGGGSYTLDFVLPSTGAGRDTTPPKINITVDAPSLRGGRVALGDTVTVTVKATDDIGVRADTLTLTKNGTSIALTLSGGATATTTIPATTAWEVITLVAAAQDTSGNVGTAEATIQVTGGGGGSEVPPPAPPDQSLQPVTAGIFPPPGDSQVDIETGIVVPFSQPVANASPDFFLLRETDLDAGITTVIDADVLVDPSDSSLVTLKPKNRLRYRARYTLVVKAGLQGTGGGSLARDYESEFRTLDLTGPTVPIANPKDVIVLDQYAIVLDRTEGLVTVDLTDPKKPVRLETTAVFSGPFAANQGFTLAPNFSYVDASGQVIATPAIVVVGWISLPQGGVRGLIRVFDATDPVHPRRVGSATIARCTTGVPMKVLVSGQYAVVASLLQGLVVVDLDTVIGGSLRELVLAAGEGSIDTGTILPIAGPIGMSFMDDAADAVCDPGQSKAVVATWDAGGQLRYPTALKPYGPNVLAGDLYTGVYQVALDTLPNLDGSLVAEGPAFRLDILNGIDVADPVTGEVRQSDVVAVTAGNGVRLVDVLTDRLLGSTNIPGAAYDLLADAARRLLFVGTGTGLQAFDVAGLSQTLSTIPGKAVEVLRRVGETRIGPALGAIAERAWNLLALSSAWAAEPGLALPQFSREPILEIYLDSDDVARGFNEQKLPGIFLFKHDDPANPRMPVIKVTARLRKEMESLRKSIGGVRWNIVVDYRIDVPHNPIFARRLGRKVRGECDGLLLLDRVSQLPSHYENVAAEKMSAECGWAALPTVRSNLDQAIEIPWSNIFLGGGFLKIRATPVYFEGSHPVPVSPETEASVSASSRGLVFMKNPVTSSSGPGTDTPIQSYVRYLAYMSPGSDWPRIEGELVNALPPKPKQITVKTPNTKAWDGSAARNPVLRPSIIAYLRNPNPPDSTIAAAAANILSKIGRTDSNGRPIYFFQVIAYKETRYEHFRKLTFNSLATETSQPAETVYPALNDKNLKLKTTDPTTGSEIVWKVGITTDGGLGIMQLTNKDRPPTYSQIWNWRKNIDEAISEIDVHVKRAEIRLATAPLDGSSEVREAEWLRWETYQRYNGGVYWEWATSKEGGEWSHSVGLDKDGNEKLRYADICEQIEVFPPSDFN